MLLLSALAACSDGGDDDVGLVVHHPLSAEIQEVRGEILGLDDSDAEALQHFLQDAGPDASKFEVQRVCGIVGKGLRRGRPATMAKFVLSAADHLTTDFFSAFDDERLAKLTNALRQLEDVPEVTQLRMEAIIRNSRGAFQGTLAEALSSVPFSDAVAPTRLPLTQIDPGPGASRELTIGAGEILRHPAFVEEGAKPDLSVEVYRRALKNWESDPVVISGLVSAYVANEDRYRDELRFLLTRAEELNSNNALYPYLRALRYFRVGRDEEGLAALRSGIARPMLSLHEIERAKCVAALLAKLGYGRLRARLAAYRAAGMELYLDLKDLADIAIRRTYEYESSEDMENLQTLLDFPLEVERQLSGTPHMRSGEEIIGTKYAQGLNRLMEFHRVRTPGMSADYRDLEKAANERLAAIEKGWGICGGQEAWGKLYNVLGEEGFLHYEDGVLFGNETKFLIECSKLEEPDRAVQLARKSWSFD